jgi:rRNA maturation RNase YbeY
VLVRDRQKARPVDTRLLRKIALALMRQLPQKASFELGIYILDPGEMSRLNETFLGHEGSTDVLAFDYGHPVEDQVLSGEIFVCLDVAVRQAARFHTTWQSELVRYVIHGVLHLKGYDDHYPAQRRKMKLQENRLLKEIALQFKFTDLAKRVR